jgi:hypothetical protein
MLNSIRLRQVFDENWCALKKYPELPVTGDFVVVLLTPQLLHALDRYIEEETRGVTRPMALKSAFEDWCLAMGYISPNEMDRRLN